jgi:hypothetical protein
MNKHIEQFGQEAVDFANTKSTDPNEFIVAFMQKFSELLVKECAVIANRAENNEFEIRCMYDIITQHFGIEK